MFRDIVEIKIKAGNGGNGVVSFRRERYVDKGGPDGGDGGDGGDIVFQVDRNQNTLSNFRHKQFISADDGGGGKARKAHGRNGETVVLPVPRGTVIYSGDELLADLTQENQSEVIAKGGKGGYGNAHFISSTRQAPEIAELGEPGEEKEIRLELKLLADVGLVGLPNAGKSTFLSVVSNAKPEIGNYPFTTLTPHLGVVDIDQQSLLMADIPGLIEGASQGKGLGDEFLRHIERTSVLLHLIDINSRDIGTDFRTIQDELAAYTKGNLTKKPQIIVLSKAENADDELAEMVKAELAGTTDLPVFVISAIAHKGLEPLLRAVSAKVQQQRKKAARTAEEPSEAPFVLRAEDDPTLWSIEKPGKGKFMITGKDLERFAIRTDFSNMHGLARFRDILRKRGVERELIRLEVNPGDKISVAGKSFEW